MIGFGWIGTAVSAGLGIVNKLLGRAERNAVAQSADEVAERANERTKIETASKRSGAARARERLRSKWTRKD